MSSSPKKRAAEPEERTVKRSDVLPKSLKEVIAIPVAVITIPDIEDSSVCYIPPDVLHELVNKWLIGEEQYDFSVADLVLKCGHFSCMKVLATAHKDLPLAKWSRVVDLLCVLRITEIQLEMYGAELRECFNFTQSTSDPLLHSADLTVTDVVHLARKWNSADVQLRADVCASHIRLARCRELEIPQLADLTPKMTAERGDLVFSKTNTGPEFDRRLYVRFCPMPMFFPTSPERQVVPYNPLIELFVTHGGGRNLLHVRDEDTNAQLETGRIQPGCFYSKQPCASEPPAFKTVERQLTIESVALPEDLQKRGFLSEFIAYLFSEHNLDAVQLRAVTNASFREEYLLKSPLWVCQEPVQVFKEWANPAFVQFKK